MLALRDGELEVNLSPEVLRLIRETKALDRNGLAIPESARMVLYLEQRVRKTNQELETIRGIHRSLQRGVRPVLKELLQPLFEELNQRIRPGLFSLTWTSMNVEEFIAEVREELQRLEQLLISVNDAVENRIEKSMREIAAQVAVNLQQIA